MRVQSWTRYKITRVVGSMARPRGGKTEQGSRVKISIGWPGWGGDTEHECQRERVPGKRSYGGHPCGTWDTASHGAPSRHSAKKIARIRAHRPRSRVRDQGRRDSPAVQVEWGRRKSLAQRRTSVIREEGPACWLESGVVGHDRPGSGGAS